MNLVVKHHIQLVARRAALRAVLALLVAGGRRRGRGGRRETDRHGSLRGSQHGLRRKGWRIAATPLLLLLLRKRLLRLRVLGNELGSRRGVDFVAKESAQAVGVDLSDSVALQVKQRAVVCASGTSTRACVRRRETRRTRHTHAQKAPPPRARRRARAEPEMVPMATPWMKTWPFS